MKFKFGLREPSLTGTRPCPSTLHQRSSVVATETIWSPKRKTFTIWVSLKKSANPSFRSQRGTLRLTHSQGDANLLCANVTFVAQRTSTPLDLLLSPASADVLSGHPSGMPSTDTGRFPSAPENTNTWARDPELVLPLPHLGPGQVGKCTSLTTPLLRPTCGVPGTRTGLTCDWMSRQTCSVTWCLRRQGAGPFFLPGQNHDPQPRA